MIDTDSGDVSIFVSYVRADDEAAYSRISKISRDLSATYTSMTGLVVKSFLDVESIRLGESWQDRIRSGLDSATILLAFITPAYLRSAACRSEFTDFLAFLPSESGRKLIIPIILFDRDRLDRLFSDDEIWIQVKELQNMDGSNLRTIEPGSQEWMTKILDLTTRIEEILEQVSTEVEASGSTVIDPVVLTAEGKEEGEGYLDLMSVAEEKIHAISELTEEYGRLLNLYTEKLNVVEPEMRRASSFSQKLAVANRLAALIDPIVSQCDEVSIELQRAISDSSPGIVTMIRMASTQSLSNGPEAAQLVEFLENIRKLGNSGIESTGQVNGLIASIEGSKGASARLDRPLQNLQTALLRFAESRSHFKTWVDEVEQQNAVD